MKPTKQLIQALRKEYMELHEKMAAASFAVSTLPLDDAEREMLWEQYGVMSEYATKLRARAKYAADKLKNTKY